jgi:hypothetical protein
LASDVCVLFYEYNECNKVLGQVTVSTNGFMTEKTAQGSTLLCCDEEEQVVTTKSSDNRNKNSTTAAVASTSLRMAKLLIHEMSFKEPTPKEMLHNLIRTATQCSRRRISALETSCGWHCQLDIPLEYQLSIIQLK